MLGYFNRGVYRYNNYLGHVTSLQPPYNSRIIHKSLPGDEEAENVIPYVILAGDAFPNKRGIMKPMHNRIYARGNTFSIIPEGGVPSEIRSESSRRYFDFKSNRG